MFNLKWSKQLREKEYEAQKIFNEMCEAMYNGNGSPKYLDQMTVQELIETAVLNDITFIINRKKVSNQRAIDL